MSITEEHPNALAGGMSAAAGGTLIVWVAGMLGYNIPDEVIPALAGACATVVLFIGREGLRGAVCRLWKGTNKVDREDGPSESEAIAESEAPEPPAYDGMPQPDLEDVDAEAEAKMESEGGASK